MAGIQPELWVDRAGGAIGGTHVRALAVTPAADVVGGVDVDRSKTLTFRGADRPVYPSVREASEACERELVVIATPRPPLAPGPRSLTPGC